jgi:hypothetical protein
LGINQDKDIITQPTASYRDIHTYEAGEGGGPDISHLVFDMRGPIDSPWNLGAIEELRRSFEDAIESKDVLVAGCAGQSTAYWQDAFTKRLKKLQGYWRDGQLQIKDSGERETEEEWRARITREQEEELKKNRHFQRRKSVGAFHYAQA